MSLRKASAVSVTVSVWPAFSHTAVGSDTVLEGRRPRIAGHSEASCTPYRVGNQTRTRPACGRVMRSTSPSSRSLAGRRRVCSIRTSGAISRCICSVVAILYCVSRASAIRFPPPVSTPIITDLLASRPVRHRPAGHCAYWSQQQPTPTGAPIPRRPDHGHEATTPPWTRPVGRTTSPLRPRVHAPQQQQQRSGWWDRRWAAGEEIEARSAGCASAASCR
jgi:hypothetical protein